MSEMDEAVRTSASAGRTRRRRVRHVALATGLAVLLAACGGNDDEPGGASGPTSADGGTSAGDGSSTTLGDRPEGVKRNVVGEYLEIGEPKRGGEITVGMESVFFPLDPASTSTQQQQSSAVHGALLRYSEDGTGFEPDMATGIEHNADYTEWTLKLRTGITFTDGEPFNAEAVVYNIQRLKDPATKYAYVNNLNSIESVTATDPTTVVFRLNRPFPVFPTLLTPGVGSGLIGSPKAMRALGADYGRSPVGAGPFKLTSWGENRIILERNPDFYKEGLPYLDRITFVTALDSQAELAALQTGDIDISLTQSDQDWARAEAEGVKVLRQRSFIQTATVFNMEREPFDDVRVRRALKYAIDEQAIVDSVFDGQREVAVGPATENHPYYHEVTDWPTYDPAEAKRLLDEYKAETGKKVEFEFDSWDPPEFQQMWTIIQQMWNQVGATANMRPLGQAELVATGQEGRYVAQSRYNGTPWRAVPDLGLYAFYHSKGGQNMNRLRDPQIDAALDAAMATTDVAIRQEQFGIVQQRLSDLMPMILHNVQSIGFYVGDEIGGFPGADPATSSAFDAERVWVK